MDDRAGPDDDAPESLVQLVRGLIGDLPGLLTDRVRLFSLEVKRAAAALGQMAALGLLAAILAATAWIALWSGFAAGMIVLGLAWPWAALIVFAINAAAAAWCALRAKALAPLLTLPATLRGLTEQPPDLSDARSNTPTAPPAGPSHAAASAAPEPSRPAMPAVFTSSVDGASAGANVTLGY